MKSGILSLVASLMMAGPTFGARKFWEEVPYQEWSREQVSKILTKSPWARQFHISRAKLEKSYRPADDRSLKENLEGRRADAPGSVGITSRGASVYVQTQTASRDLDSTGGAFGSFVPVTVRWESAMPVKWAWSRIRELSRVRARADDGEWMAKDSSHVVVSVSGLPPRMIPVEATAKDRFLDAARSRSYLKVGKRTRWLPTGARLGKQQRWVALYVLFPRDKVRPVDPGDKTIEFVTRISDQKISRKFKLKDMVLEGKLAF